jgi:uncharacterized membrane protein YdjX (TVP38/TMEM64 family)
MADVRQPADAAKKRAALRFGILLLVILLVVLVFRFTPVGSLAKDNAQSLVSTLRGLPAAPLLFVLLYAAAAALALPGSVLTLAGGAVFGLWLGFGLNLIAATIGATLAFLLARALGRDFVSQRLGDRAASLDKSVAEHGFRTIFMLRLIPLVPYNALNYGAGLTAVRLAPYVAASALGMIPGTFAYTYFADAILAGSLEARRDAYLHMAAAGALLLLLSLLPLAYRRWHKPAAK